MLFGAHWNAQQDFQNSANTIMDGGAVNFFGGLALGRSVGGLAGKSVSFGEYAGSQVGDTLGGSLGGEIGQVVGRASAEAVGVSGTFMGGYLASSSAICLAEAESGS